MEFANDLLASLRVRVQPGGDSGKKPRFDWPGLHARLAAAHAARAELAACESHRAAVGGGFDQWVGSVHPASKPSRRINLTDSTDSKAPSGIAVAVAGQSRAGD